jgi:hypothetical protein
MSEDDEWAPYTAEGIRQAEDEARRREDDLRVRMVALDMSITALPQYTGPTDSPGARQHTQDGLISHFEHYLRTGELGS